MNLQNFLSMKGGGWCAGKGKGTDWKGPEPDHPCLKDNVSLSRASGPTRSPSPPGHPHIFTVNSMTQFFFFF